MTRSESPKRSKMSDKTPSLSQYFVVDNRNKSDVQVSFTNEITEATKKLGNLQIENVSKSEPEVCRLFAETAPQVKDPTAAFFDLIGNPSKGTEETSVPDLGLPADVSLGVNTFRPLSVIYLNMILGRVLS